jgi:ParB-like chromosome segregation protein Spo0J
LDNVNILLPTQTDFNQDKVDQIKSDWNYIVGNQKPIIASKEDGFVLDGHHRFFAAKQLGTGINVIFVDLPINKLLAISNIFLDKN